MRDSNAPAHAGDEPDPYELWPEDAVDELEALCDSQLADVIAELEAGKPWQ